MHRRPMEAIDHNHLYEILQTRNRENSETDKSEWVVKYYRNLYFLEPRASFRCPVHSIPNIPTPYHDPEQHDFEEEPSPASPLLVPARIVRLRLSLLFAASRCPRVLPYVQIIRVDRDDVVVVSEFARMRAESKVGSLRELEGFSLEAFGPFVFGFVLELNFQ